MKMCFMLPFLRGSQRKVSIVTNSLNIPKVNCRLIMAFCPAGVVSVFPLCVDDSALCLIGRSIALKQEVTGAE